VTIGATMMVAGDRLRRPQRHHRARAEGRIVAEWPGGRFISQSGAGHFSATSPFRPTWRQTGTGRSSTTSRRPREEQRLFAKGSLSDAERHKLRINIELDQAFDLLRRAGPSPNRAQADDAEAPAKRRRGLPGLIAASGMRKEILVEMAGIVFTRLVL
jgi:hypothetical protein